MMMSQVDCWFDGTGIFVQQILVEIHIIIINEF